jgi:hypothetical protein
MTIDTSQKDLLQNVQRPFISNWMSSAGLAYSYIFDVGGLGDE